jgi:hypothetical protein
MYFTPLQGYPQNFDKNSNIKLLEKETWIEFT